MGRQLDERRRGETLIYGYGIEFMILTKEKIFMVIADNTLKVYLILK